MKIKIKKAKNNQFYLLLVSSKNGETLYKSEEYTRKADAKRAAEGSQRNFPGAEIVDETPSRGSK